MSDYNVIGAVGDTLRDLIWTGIESDSAMVGMGGILKDKNHLSFEPPFRLFKDDGPGDNYLSLYLFRVLENPDLKNGPQFPNPAPDYAFPPLVLNLFFLITPLTNSSLNDQKLLGRVMQLFHDHAIVAGSELRGVLQTRAEELRLSLNPLSLEDITKLWSAFLRPFRLSVCYEARAVIVDSERSTRAERVQRKRVELHSIDVLTEVS